MMRKLTQGIPCPLRAARAACVTLPGMKDFLWIPIAIFLFPASVWTQALPDAPAPHTAQATALPDARWNRIKQISDGQPIVVRTISGDLVHCRFAGATDSCLFCDPSGPLLNEPGNQFDRASVLNVREHHEERNWHPVLLTAMAIVGTAVGIARTRNMDDRGAASAGLLSAGLTGLIGYGAGQFQTPYAYGGYGYGFAFRPHGMHLRQRPAK